MAKKTQNHVAKPVYPGGPAAMKEFISRNLQYPLEARQAGIAGTVFVRYTVDYRGVVVDAKVKDGIGYGCDEEALRVVKLLRFSVPQQRKRKVRIHQDIGIHFQIHPANDDEVKPRDQGVSTPEVQISYTLVASKDSATGLKSTNNSTYTYTYRVK